MRRYTGCIDSRLLQSLADNASRIPLFRWTLNRVYRRRFNNATGRQRLFRGIYPDFVTASQDIPRHRLRGYDNEASAALLAHHRLRIFPFDYPVMFWLQKLLPECQMLFDFGGNVGISYFGYRRYLQYAPALTWLIYDVDAVVAAGEQIARAECAANLKFTTSLAELSRADLLLAAGSLQFIEEPLATLRSVPRLPRHVLLNKLPVGALPAATTLHNMGSALCPYRLFNRKQFVEGVLGLGYELVDEWANPDLGLQIPFFPERSLRAYTGFYFRRPD